MPNPAIAAWIVAIAGWLVVAALALLALYYVIDLLVRLAGVSGWMYATTREVQARHDWNADLDPWWLKALNNTHTPPDILKPLFRRRKR